VATMHERHTSSNRARWIAFLLVGAAIAVGVVLVVLYGGGGSGSGPY
jgi:ABC-type transporter Mla subunit MlaD